MLAFGFAGCAAPGASTTNSAPVAQVQKAANPESRPIKDRTAPLLIREPEGSLTLRDALALTLARNPALAVFALEDRIAEARVLQAGLRPNPDLTLTVEDVLGTGTLRGARQAETTLQLGQLVELGGKRAARREAAAAARASQQREYELERIERLAEATEKFIHVVGDQQELALAREAVAWTERALSAVRQRIQAGRASALEEKRALILLARSRIEEEHAEHELLSARVRLTALWGATKPAFEEAQADLFQLRSVPPLDQLLARLPASPQLQRWLTEQQLRDAEVKLARAQARPSLLVGGGLRRVEGSDEHALVLQFSMPLPVSDRNQGAVAEAQARREQVDLEQRDTQVRLHTLLFGLYQELIHKQTELESLDRVILPAAEEALALAQQGFEQGRFSQLDLLDARRTLLELKLEQIQAATAYHNFVVELERLLGEPLEAAPATPDSPQP